MCLSLYNCSPDSFYKPELQDAYLSKQKYSIFSFKEYKAVLKKLNAGCDDQQPCDSGEWLPPMSLNTRIKTSMAKLRYSRVSKEFYFIY
jgi:hypothetical protein